MFLLLLVVYFVLAVALVALLVLPAFRARALMQSASAWRALRRAWRGTRSGAGDAVASTARLGGGVLTDFAGYVLRHRFMLLGGLALVALPVALSIAFGARSMFVFDDAPRQADDKVSILLRGEQLAAPQALPPEVFATAEVEQVRPLTNEGSRNWDALDADFRNRLLWVYKIMKDKHGYDMALLEGYRSPERQAKLAALGTSVTQAQANRSYHQYGLAADSAFYRDGGLVISEKVAWAMEGYRLYGEVAESLGLVWGGRWSFQDYGHVEYRKPGFKMPRD